MRTLTKKTLRDLKGLGWRAVGIAMILAMGVWFFAGGFMARDTIFNTRDYYYDLLKLADLDLYFDAVEQLPRFDMPGITLSKRFYRKTSIDMAGVDPATIMVIHQHEIGPRPVNDLQLVSGDWLQPKDGAGILLERGFAEAHGYKVGDSIYLRSIGAPQEVIIRGIVITPENLVPMGNPYQLVPAKGALGVAFASMDYVLDSFGYPMYNNLCFLFHNKKDAGELKRAIMEKMQGIRIIKATERSEQFSYKFLQQIYKGFNVFIPAVVFLVSVVVIIVTMMAFNRLIQAQRREIGVFMALGYRARHLFVAFLVTGAGLGLAGGLIGGALSPLMCRLIGQAYAVHIGLPELCYIYPIKYVVVGVGIGILITILSSAPPLLAIFSITPRDAIGGMATDYKVSRIFGLIAGLAGRSLIFKYSVRNLLRRLGSSLAVIALIAFSISICTAFYASSESWEYYAQKAIAQEKWDLVAIFRAPLTWAEARLSWDREEISDIRPMIGQSVVIKGGDFERHFMLSAVPDLRQVVDLDFSQGGYFSSDDAREVIFTAIDNLPVKVGDTVTVAIEDKHYKFRVAGILKRMTIRMAYIPMKTAQEIIPDKPQAFFAHTSLPGKKLRELIYASDENIGSVQPKSDIRGAVFEFLGYARILTKIGLGVSLFLSVLFLLTGLTLNIRERESEYATFVSLGFSNRFIVGVVLVETVIEGVLAVILSLPLSYYFSYFLNHEMSRAWFEVDLYLAPKDIVTVIAYAMVFLPFAAIPGIRHLLTMDIADTVRQRGFG